MRELRSRDDARSSSCEEKAWPRRPTSRSAPRARAPPGALACIASPLRSIPRFHTSAIHAVVPSLFLVCLPLSQTKDITCNLVAWLAYMVDQICGVAPRDKGHGADGQLHQGELVDHTEWNMGIHKALKFMKDRVACPTRSTLVSGIQKKKKSSK